MRVFKIFYFELDKKVSFKDYLTYAENWIDENDIKYNDMIFKFSGWYYGDSVNKVINKYPSMQKYKIDLNPGKHDTYLSSVKENWLDNNSLHVDKQDINILKEIASKPRTFRFSNREITFDNVKWYPGINLSPAIDDSYKLCDCNYWENKCQINSIKVYDSYVKKGIKVNIEVMNSNNKLINIDHVLTKLIKKFGKPTLSYMRIIWDKEEFQMNNKYKEELNSILQPIEKEFQVGIENRKPIKYRESSVEVRGLSPKKAIIKQIKSTGYEYINCKNGCYECKKINENNHLFNLNFDLTPIERIFRADFRIKGYNFCKFIDFSEIDPGSQTDIEKYVEEAVSIALKIEERISDTLLRLFGETPRWFEFS